jgi:hypothetical protein
MAKKIQLIGKGEAELVYWTKNSQSPSARGPWGFIAPPFPSAGLLKEMVLMTSITQEGPLHSNCPSKNCVTALEAAIIECECTMAHVHSATIRRPRP